jgi:hypothetical protein
LTEIYLCHACCYHEIEDGHAPDRWFELGGWKLRVDTERKSLRAEALYWLLRRAVERGLRLQPHFQPLHVAEQRLVLRCEQTLTTAMGARELLHRWEELMDDPEQLMAEQLLDAAREFVDELREQILSAHQEEFRRVLEVIPALFSRKPTLKLGFAKMLGRAGPAPLVVLVLTQTRLEVHEELVDSALPFQPLLSVELLSLGGQSGGEPAPEPTVAEPARRGVEDWSGRTAGRSGMASATTLRLTQTPPAQCDAAEIKAREGLPNYELWFDPGTMEAKAAWTDAILSAVARAQERGEGAADAPVDGDLSVVIDRRHADAAAAGQQEEDEHKDESMSRIDDYLVSEQSGVAPPHPRTKALN